MVLHNEVHFLYHSHAERLENTVDAVLLQMQYSNRCLIFVKLLWNIYCDRCYTNEEKLNRIVFTLHLKHKIMCHFHSINV